MIRLVAPLALAVALLAPAAGHAVNGCAVTSPTPGNITTTETTCTLGGNVAYASAVTGGWTVISYKTTSCAAGTGDANIDQTITNTSVSTASAGVVNGTGNRCVRIRIDSGSGTIAVEGN